MLLPPGMVARFEYKGLKYTESWATAFQKGSKAKARTDLMGTDLPAPSKKQTGSRAPQRHAFSHRPLPGLRP